MSKQEKKKDVHPIDALVDELDDTFFRLRSVDLWGDSWGVETGRDHRQSFETAACRDAHKRLYEAMGNLAKATSKKEKAAILSDLDKIFWECITESEDYPRMLGFVFGLRLAGLSNDDTKRIAKTWRIGSPGDEEKAP